MRKSLVLNPLPVDGLTFPEDGGSPTKSLAFLMNIFKTLPLQSFFSGNYGKQSMWENVGNLDVGHDLIFFPYPHALGKLWHKGLICS